MYIIYDGDCFVCSQISKFVDSSTDSIAIERSNSGASEFLSKQFGDNPPHTLVAVSEYDNKVYTGGNAAGIICEEHSIPHPIRKILESRYKDIAQKIQSFSTGKLVSDDEEVYKLTADLSVLKN